MRLQRWLLGFCLLWLSTGACAASVAGLSPARPESVGFSSERLQLLDDYFQQQVASGQLPGAAVLLARHGRVVAFDTYGKADADRGVAMSKDAIFRVFSQTKVVTAVAMLLLFEEGRWQFDDPVTRFVPEFEKLKVFKRLKDDGSMQLVDASRPPTMRELLTHSAGFGYGLDSSSPVERAYSASGFIAAPSANEAIARLARLPLVAEPGERWHYSAAVDIQGYIVERISGQTLADFMQQRIFGPLKMKDTAFHVSADKRHRLVPLKVYDSGSGKLTTPGGGSLGFSYDRPPGAASGGAGLVSTAGDYARFAQMLLNGGELDGARILSPAAVKLMTANHLADNIRALPGTRFGVQGGLGFGVNVAVVEDSAKAGTLRGEGSFNWDGAAGTWFWVDPKNDLIFIGMIQVMNRWGSPKLKNIDSETQSLVYRALVAPQD